MVRLFCHLVVIMQGTQSSSSHRRRLLLGMLLYSVLQLGVVVLISYWYIGQAEYQDKGERALDVARIVAGMPELVSLVTARDSEQLQPLIEQMRQRIDASFIVIGDEQGIRLAHPRADRLGKPMVGGDSQAALREGKSYYSTATGSLGRSVPGNVPIRGMHGQIIGIVSVGYLLNRLDLQLRPYLWFMALSVCIVVLFNLLVGWYLAERIKRVLLGYEPEQISHLYAEQGAILNAIREGVVAVDTRGKITTINDNALRLMDQPDAASMLGQSLPEGMTRRDFEALLKEPEQQKDVEIWLNDQIVIANRVPMYDEHGALIGIVSSFRPRDEMTQLSQQLSQSRAQSEALRAQNHEHANQLNTIAGMIALGDHQGALEFIGQETHTVQEFIHFLLEAFPDSVLSGCILGKFHRARELGLELQLDPGSSLQTIPPHIRAEQLVTVLANLIDNALEATLASGSQAAVQLSVTDLGRDLILEVEDQAGGIAPEVRRRMFESGISTKQQAGHGIGLHLVQQIVELLHGSIEVDALANGSRFTVYIPREPNQDETHV